MEYSSNLKKFGTGVSPVEIEETLAAVHRALPKNRNEKVYKRCFGAIDLTSLNSTDSKDRIDRFVTRAVELPNHYPEVPNVASVCVYPVFVETAGMAIGDSGMSITSVCGGFPSSQTYLEVKMLETAMAVENGADEVDVVISIGEFLNGEYDLMGNEIEMPERDVEITSLELLSFDGRDAVIRTSVSKGTYIRSLARDIASAAGSAGHLSHLRRLRIGPWRLEDIGRSTWDLLSSAGLFSEIKLSERERKRIENGTIVPGAILSDSAPERPYAFLRFSDELYGIGEKRDGRLRIIERLS